MKLRQAVDLYLAHKQSLGMRCQKEAQTLRAFCQAMGEIGVDEVRDVSVNTFIRGTGSVTSHLHRKLSVLRGFYRYLITRGFVPRSPLPTSVPKEPQRLIPYIYTREELRRVMDAAERQRHWCKIEVLTMRALLLLLYGAGLRIGEALRLTMADVDLEQRYLIIRETKFYKTRLTPLGTDLAQIITTYQNDRVKRHPALSRAPFLVTRHGQALNIQLAELSFKRLCLEAGVRRTDGSRFSPRLHDLRHSFAVHRLTAWYREGADVQRLLPHLSTYLGHVHIGCTQRYLTMTPELLQQASCRFEQYSSPEVPHD